MMKSTFEHIQTQPTGSTTASILARSTMTEGCRVVVQHVNGGIVFISDDQNDVVPSSGAAPTTKSYRLLPGNDEVFILAPKQALYAVGGGIVTVSVSNLPGLL